MFKHIISTSLITTSISLPLATVCKSAERPSLLLGGQLDAMYFSGKAKARGAYTPLDNYSIPKKEKGGGGDLGLFFDIGNKYSYEGFDNSSDEFIYNLGGYYTNTYAGRLKPNNFSIGLQVGWRLGLNATNQLDILVGGGYMGNDLDGGAGNWTRNIRVRRPYGSLALGWNHAIDSNNSTRIELGGRRNIAASDIHMLSGNRQLNAEITPYLKFDYIHNLRSRGQALFSSLTLEYDRIAFNNLKGSYNSKETYNTDLDIKGKGEVNTIKAQLQIGVIF